MKNTATIFYGGFLGKSGGAFMHARSFGKVLEKEEWLVNVVTLDSLPIYLRYVPHLLGFVLNIFWAPLGFYYKDRLTQRLYRLLFDDDVQLRVFEDIYLSWNSDVPSVTLLHAVWSDNLQSLSLKRDQERRLIAREARVLNMIRHPVVTVSEPYRRYLISEHFADFDLREIVVVPLGLDISTFGNGTAEFADSRSMVYCGTLEARKNVLFLLDVFKSLREVCDSYALTIIGDGPDRASLERYCEANSLPVNFVGRLDHEAALQEMKRHCIYLHTSLKESFSFALLEAKLLGLKTYAFVGLQVPIEFIDVPISDFDVDLWRDAILERRPSYGSTFDRYRYSSDAMAKKTLALVSRSTSTDL